MGDASLSQDEINSLLHETEAADADEVAGMHDLLEEAGPAVEPAEFSPLTQAAEPAAANNIRLLQDVPMEVSVELGRTSKTVKEILRLGEGSIIELDKLAGEPVDLRVNGAIIAHGEVVVIDENFGIRITDLASLKERLPSA